MTLPDHSLGGNAWEFAVNLIIDYIHVLCAKMRCEFMYLPVPSVAVCSFHLFIQAWEHVKIPDLLCRTHSPQQKSAFAMEAALAGNSQEESTMTATGDQGNTGKPYIVREHSNQEGRETQSAHGSLSDYHA
jgi:hypothetical protein